jgi:hypothetical protein
MFKPSHVNGFFRITLLVLILLIVQWIGTWPSQAQSGNWSRPVELGVGWFPDIAADASGRVHVAWASSNTLPPADEGTPVPTETSGYYDTVMYASTLNGAVWESQNDIAARAQSGGSEVTRPSLLIDAEGIFHMTYRDRTVYYSHAAANNASTAKSWLPPFPISYDQVGYFSRLAIDSQGRLHLIYTENVPNSGCPICYHVFYRYSDDQGMNWSGRTDILNLQTGAAKPHILIDSQDRIHVVWEAGQGGAYGQLTDPTTVMYTVSSDGGQSWAAPIELNQPGQWAKAVTLGQDRQGNLIVIWLGLPEDLVYYQLSYNQGRSWSRPRPIPGILGGWSVYSARLDCTNIAADASGNLHLALVGRTAAEQTSLSVLHLRWDGSTWSAPESVVTLEGDVPEWPRIVVSQGNRLNVVWFVRPSDHIWDANPHYYRVYYARGSADAPAVTASAWPTATPTSTPIVSVQTTATQTPPPPEIYLTPVSPAVGDAIYTELDEMLGIAMGLGPALLLVIIIFSIVHLRRRSQSS